MLVKQVFPRSMWVWIFAVALLVVKTCCADLRFDLKLVTGITENARQISRQHLELLLELQNYWYLLHEKSREPDFSRTKNDLMNLAKQRAVEGMQFNLNYPEVVDYDLEPLYKKEGNPQDVLKEVPSGSGVYAAKITRMQVFGAYLHGLKGAPEENVMKLAERVKASQDHIKIRDPLSKIIAKFGELPFFNGNERYTDLPKTTKEVDWLEVRETFDAMKLLLTKYCQIRDYPVGEMIVRTFLQYKEGKIDISILEVLNNLYKTHRFYRISASETHNIYVKDRPGALDYTRKLRNTIRRLNRFASVLQIVSENKKFNEIRSKNHNLKTVIKLLRNLDYTKEIWKCYVVQNLSDVLSSPPDEFTAPESIPGDKQELIGKLTKLFVEVEGSMGIYKTYTSMQSRAQEGIKNSESAGNLIADIRFLVALIDSRAKNFRKMIQSNETREICEELENLGPPIGAPNWDSHGLLRRGTVLCSEVCSGQDDVPTFYSLFLQFGQLAQVCERKAIKRDAINPMLSQEFAPMLKLDFRMKDTMENLKEIISKYLNT